MKLVVIYTLLFLTGAFFTYVVIHNEDILDWAKLNPVLEEQNITTQAATVKFVQRYYERGLLTEYYHPKGVMLFLLALFVAAFGAVAAAHALIDKLLWKKFYEQPEVWKATRRGILVAGVVAALGYLALYNLLEIGLVILPLLLAICLELLFSTGRRV